MGIGLLLNSDDFETYVTCKYVEDFETWEEYTSFDEFFEYLITHGNWNVHIGAIIQTWDKTFTIDEYVMENASDEQKDKYLNFIRSGIEKLYDKIPELRS